MLLGDDSNAGSSGNDNQILPDENHDDILGANYGNTKATSV